MKHLRALGLVGTMAAIAPLGMAWADNTDQEAVTVSGAIVAALEVASTPMIMPEIVKPNVGESQPAAVRLTCDQTADSANTVQYSNQSNPFADGVAGAQNPSSNSANGNLAGVHKTGECAVLTVTGQPNYFFAVNVGAITSPATGVTFRSPTCATTTGLGAENGDTRQIPAGGTVSIRCGGRIEVTDAVTPGTYTMGTFPYTVTYD